MTFDSFIGHETHVRALRQMIREKRLPQTLLFAGPRGVGKATLARLLAAAMNCKDGPGEVCGTCSHCRRILAADLSLDEYQSLFAEREKLPSAKRVETPLIVSTHPDFLTFPPDGPLRLITMEQARQLRAAAQFGPSEGRRRLFLIDQADHANAEAANSLLKTLEEPAPSLTLVLTAENPYDLLPTIRSRSIPFYFSPLSPPEMDRFFDSRPGVAKSDRQVLAGWSQGSPGRALAINVKEYLQRRDTMLALLRTGLNRSSFGELMPQIETAARAAGTQFDQLTESLAGLLQDLLHLHHGSATLINADIRPELDELSGAASFPWVESAAAEVEEMDRYRRRNIQPQIAFDALVLRMRRQSA